MRDLKKNQQTLYYSNYLGKQPILDVTGDETGEYKNSYSSPVLIKANLSSGTGNVETSPFGVNVDYTRILSVGNINLPIKENTLFWYETLPGEEANPETADYIVATKPAISLNKMVIALKARAKNG